MKEAKMALSPAIGADGVALVAYVQQRREEERSRLSRMLHHDVSGMLAAVRMDLSRVSSRVTDDDTQDQLRKIDQLLEQVIRDARTEMQRLHPALLDHFGLPLAIRHLVEETCRAKEVRYAVALDETLEGVDPEILIAAFRLAETLLGDASDLTEFKARLAPRRDGYLLELARVPAYSPLEMVTGNADLDALRAWLRSLGAVWLESAQGDCSTIELRIPRRSPTSKSETPGG